MPVMEAAPVLAAPDPRASQWLELAEHANAVGRTPLSGVIALALATVPHARRAPRMVDVLVAFSVLRAAVADLADARQQLLTVPHIDPDPCCLEPGAPAVEEMFQQNVGNALAVLLPAPRGEV